MYFANIDPLELRFWPLPFLSDVIHSNVWFELSDACLEPLEDE